VTAPFLPYPALRCASRKPASKPRLRCMSASVRGDSGRERIGSLCDACWRNDLLAWARTPPSCAACL